MANWAIAGAPMFFGQLIIWYQPSAAVPVVIISFVAGIALAYRFVNTLDFFVLGGLRYVANQLDKMADEADISAEFKAKSDDEVGHLVRALGKAFNTFRTIIRMSQDSTTNTAMASHSLASTAEQLINMTEQVSNAITQVAQGASEQSRSALQVSGAMEDMAESVQLIYKGASIQTSELESNAGTIKELASVIEEVADTADSVSKLAAESAEAAKDGKDVVDKTVEGMDKICDTVMETAGKIQELGKSSQQIGEIVAVIEDIAEQTNLLALNAAIEAARAGEQGKGFAVVADEVRKLAERSAMATKEIANLISQIQRGTNNAVEAMQSGTENVQEGMALAESAGSSLQSIHKLIKEVSTKIAKMAESSRGMVERGNKVVQSIDHVYEITNDNKSETDKLAAKSEEILSEITNISSVAEQTAASSQQVAASAQEQTSMVQRLADSAEALATLAEKLHSEVGQFKTEKEQTGLSGVSVLNISTGKTRQNPEDDKVVAIRVNN